MEKTYHQFNRILIANRGEIAVRVIKTARDMGIETVAIYTDAEEDALHVEKADLKAMMTGHSLQDTYLNPLQIVQLAKRYRVDAIHPGYGFLSENDEFAQLCIANNIAFIGPSPQQIKMMGNKDEANKIALECKVPLLKKVNGNVDEMINEAKKLKLPLIIKAAAGGGGKGMRIVNDFKELETEIERAAAEAARYFNNPSVYIEQYIENPRHIEVQVIGDSHGNIIHLHERECSIQRRHQKVIEEAPAPNLDSKVKKAILNDALKLTKHIGYVSAGTIEFLLTPNQEHYFLEMNTRIQVEHPVSEEITGVDIVREQILIASGMPISFSQDEITICGHAIEARIYAENPEDNFKPSFGQIIGTHIPSHPNIRIDGGAQATENLNPNFDPLLKKVIALGNNRDQAIKRLRSFLNNYALFGVESNREFIIKALEDKDFEMGKYDTSFFQAKHEYLLSKNPLQNSELEVISAAFVILKNNTQISGDNIWRKTGYWRQSQQHQIRFSGYKLHLSVIYQDTSGISLEIDEEDIILISSIRIEQNELSFIIQGKHFSLNYTVGKDGLFYIQYCGRKWAISDKPERSKRSNKDENNDFIKRLEAPMPGRIIDILVKEGEQIKKGNPLLVLEAMKTENSINAWKDTTITKVNVNKGEQVSLNQLLIETE
ncbi:acetyl/propionyl/methylcrotonyl-CoA carboxylase subunit alpha [Labilibacter marinus]|uniref:acetyl/propionyl/methylcrotonyl-CoA carboxylase subunit alpha n=1 Tax=Labilibacter marinus TaxID=1477105 RepID=UPI00082A590B|nr:biotin carboxylase N-terminal domain-containing protein [Labilibacter marinus]